MRALVMHWNELYEDYQGTGGWGQQFEYVIVGEGARAVWTDIVTLADNDSAAQIKAKVAAAIRARAVAEWGRVVESNQIIFPDASRG